MVCLIVSTSLSHVVTFDACLIRRHFIASPLYEDGSEQDRYSGSLHDPTLKAATPTQKLTRLHIICDDAKFFYQNNLLCSGFPPNLVQKHFRPRHCEQAGCKPCLLYNVAVVNKNISSSFLNTLTLLLHRFNVTAK